MYKQTLEIKNVLKTISYNSTIHATFKTITVHVNFCLKIFVLIFIMLAVN